MKLIATVTLVTKTGHEVVPGSVVEVKDAAEAARLVKLGFAKPAEPAEPAEPAAQAAAGQGEEAAKP